MSEHSPSNHEVAIHVARLRSEQYTGDITLLRGWAAEHIEQLQQDLARTENARVVLLHENEHYKQRVAELERNRDALKADLKRFVAHAARGSGASDEPPPSSNQLSGLLCDVAQFMDGCKTVAPQEWTDWDQTVRDRLSEQLTLLEASKHVVTAVDLAKTVDARVSDEPTPSSKKKLFNDWWLSLSEGRRKVLMEDKWSLASAAWEAGQSANAYDPHEHTHAAYVRASAEPPVAPDYTAIYEACQIGSAVRTPQVLLANAENAMRRSDCLSAIEREFFTSTEQDDDGEEMEVCKLNWGSDAAAYVEQFRAALTELRTTEPPAEGQFTIGESVRVGPFPHSGEYSKVMKITGARYFCDHEYGPYDPSVIVRAAVTKSAGLCPRPFRGRPDGFTAANCVAAGECGCDARNAGETAAARCCDINASHPGQHREGCTAAETSSTPSVALSIDSGRPMTLRECMEAEDGIPFQPMEANTDPLTHQEIFSAVYHHASEIVRLTAAVPTQCTAPSEEASR